MAGAVRMGYEAQLFIGSAGNTAATQVVDATDVDYNCDCERADTTPRGDGSAVPIVTSKAVGLKPTITFKHHNKPDSSVLSTIIAAAKTGASLAMRTKSYSSGLGFDGDVTISMKQSSPLKGGTEFEFTCEATDDEGRSPLLWT